MLPHLLIALLSLAAASGPADAQRDTGLPCRPATATAPGHPGAAPGHPAFARERCAGRGG